MTLDLLEGGNYFAALMDGNLTTTSWEADGDYLPSYSIDPSNTYSKSQASSDYLFSGYYISVRDLPYLYFLCIFLMVFSKF